VSSKECPTVIPYYGGKYEMSRRLIHMLPKHERYFEVFFGGGSLYFRKNKASWNVLNDIDNDLVNLYICVLDRFDELAERIYWSVRSRKLHDNYKETIKSTQEINIPDPVRASQYFYIVRNSFNNQPYNSFSKDTYWGLRIKEELKQSRDKLDGATIENLDFRELIPRYTIREGDFLYLDPPYVVADKKKYYRNNFTYELHEEMKELMDHVDKQGAKFMISYDNVDRIADLYEEYNVDRIITKYVGSNPDIRGEERKELIITNYEITKPQEELFN